MSARVACGFGGIAPCCDDLCYGGHTLCGLEEGFDFCWHHNDPDSCDECGAEDDDWYDYAPSSRVSAEGEQG